MAKKMSDADRKERKRFVFELVLRIVVSATASVLTVLYLHSNGYIS